LTAIVLSDSVHAAVLAVPPETVAAVRFENVASRDTVVAWRLVLDRTYEGAPVDAYAVVV
jgi:regulator of extracellular matrix RemA (YlzA/DUF370 family)